MKVSFSYVGTVAFTAKWSLKVILLHEISSFRMGRKNDVVRSCSCEMDSICAILVCSSCILQFRLRNTTFTFSQNVCTSSSPSILSYQCCQLFWRLLNNSDGTRKNDSKDSKLKLATLYLTDSQFILGGKSECWHSQFSIMISKLQYLLKNMSDLSWNIYISFGRS